MTILSTNKIDITKNYLTSDPDKKVTEDIQEIWGKFFNNDANSDLMLVLEQLLSMLSQLKKIPNIDFSKLTFKIENNKIIICYKNQELFSGDKNSNIEAILSKYLINKDENNYVFDLFKIKNQIEEIKNRNSLGENYISQEIFNYGYFLTLSLLNNVLNSINRKSTNKLIGKKTKINDSSNLSASIDDFYKKNNNALLYKECKGFNQFIEISLNKLVRIINEPVLVSDDQSTKDLSTNFKKHKYLRTLLKTFIYVLQIMEKNRYIHQNNLYDKLIKNNTLIDNIKEYIEDNNALHNVSLDFLNKELTFFKRNLEEIYVKDLNYLGQYDKNHDLIMNILETKKILNNIQIQSS